MGFVRTKKIKGFEYAYVVQSKWRKKGIKQKVKAYLGRVYRFDVVKDIVFSDFISRDIEEYMKNSNKEKVIKDLVGFELVKHGFDEKNGLWTNGDCIVNVEKGRVSNKRKSKASLAFNEGFLCDYNIRKLMKFDVEGEEEEVSYNLAKLFVESGIAIPQEIFVGLFRLE